MLVVPKVIGQVQARLHRYEILEKRQKKAIALCAAASRRKNNSSTVGIDASRADVTSNATQGDRSEPEMRTSAITVVDARSGGRLLQSPNDDNSRRGKVTSLKSPRRLQCRVVDDECCPDMALVGDVRAILFGSQTSHLGRAAEPVPDRWL